ncbi:LamG-like jellyroll fold domain-containing protein, partial [Planctomycetota bacterium]
TVNFTIGAEFDGASAVIGKMDDVRLYNVALTGNEIRDMLGLPPLPVAHWTFDEEVVVDANDPNDPDATITIAPDVSGNGYDGILTSVDPNAVGPVIMDGVLVCDGNGFVDIPVEAWNDNICEGYTVSFRMSIDTVHSTVPVTARGENNKFNRNFSCHAPWSNGIVYFDTRTEAKYDRISVGGTQDQWLGKWVDWTFVYSPGLMEIYLDGVLFLSGAKVNDIVLQDTVNFTIGAEFDGASAVIGMMDDVCLYDVALTGDEIRDILGLPPLPVAHWTFDEVVVVDANDPNDPNATISIVPDVSGNGYDGTLEGDVTLVAGQHGLAASINTKEAAVVVPGEAWNDNIPDANSFSFCIWVNVSADSWATASTLFRGGGATNRAFQCHFPWTGGQIIWDQTNAGRANLGSVWDAAWNDEWTHAAFVYEDGGARQLYVNGEALLDTTDSGAVPTDMNNIWLGNGQDNDGVLNRGIEGLIDDVRLYDTVLTGEEIQDIFGIVAEVE